MSFLIVFDFYKDYLQTNNGYSFLWLTILYCFGFIIRELEIFDKFNMFQLFLIMSIVFCCSIFLIVINNFSLLLSYVSPFVIIESICLLGIFSKLHFKNNLVLNVSKLTFGIYLFQNNKIIWMYLSNSFVFISNYQIVLKVFFVLLASLVLFLIGAVVDYIRTYTFKIIKIDDMPLKIDNFIKEKSKHWIL